MGGATVYRTCWISEADASAVDSELRLAGWIETYRDHGGLVFFHLRDGSGRIQCVADPELLTPQEWQQASSLRAEWVVAFRGKLRRRPAGTERTSLDNKEIELSIEGLDVLSRSRALPFKLSDTDSLSEEVRMAFRYLDLRNERMQRNLRLRSKLIKSLRDGLDSRDFCEVETPILGKSTPEGARDYLVPSRIHPRSYYALPQSPQLFKQLLMIGGIERYFQVARCFRDEDLRANRQPEFTQLDMELSFVDESDVMNLTESLVRESMVQVGQPDPGEFPRLSYAEAIDRFGSDKPDVSPGMELIEITEALRNTEFKIFRKLIDEGGAVMAIRVPSEHTLSKKQIELIRDYAEDAGASAPAWGHVREGKFVSQLAKYFSDEERADMVRLLEPGTDGDLILFQAGSDPLQVRRNLGEIRLIVADLLGLRNPKRPLHFCWITHFPLLEFDSARTRFKAMHHPFTQPDDCAALNSDDHEALLSISARSYDLVLNGEEIGGGSIRIHDPLVQRRIFEVLSIPDEEVSKKFGFFLRALEYGAPPHGGIALGLDRLASIIAGEDSIRDVIAFPKTQSASCPLTGAPTPVTGRRDLGIF
ncbi:MAG: aspartate--tRNA ligase [Candidatus Alcyoniella australis]|nr:aspartate--tRNA ligase [Candidatus Alcyoniella australis]